MKSDNNNNQFTLKPYKFTKNNTKSFFCLFAKRLNSMSCKLFKDRMSHMQVLVRTMQSARQFHEAKMNSKNTHMLPFLFTTISLVYSDKEWVHLTLHLDANLPLLQHVYVAVVGDKVLTKFLILACIMVISWISCYCSHCGPITVDNRGNRPATQSPLQLICLPPDCFLKYMHLPTPCMERMWHKVNF